MDGAGGEKLDPASVLLWRRRRGAGWFSVRAATCAVQGVNGTPGLHREASAPFPPQCPASPGAPPRRERGRRRSAQQTEARPWGVGVFLRWEGSPGRGGGGLSECATLMRPQRERPVLGQQTDGGRNSGVLF